MDAEVCPEDGVPTVEASVLRPGEGPLPLGAILSKRYRVEEAIGQGGMGAVYKATQLSMDRTIALKVLKSSLSADANVLKRFYREARAMTALDHPNIVRVFDFGVDEGARVPFLAMEFLEGKTLRSIVDNEGRLPERRTCQLLSDVSRALVAAHEAGIVHRDLKPDNIMVRVLADGDEHTKVLDFGVAKIVHSDSDTGANLTASGAAIGTPLYMSPEQISGEEIDFRADLYALGCVMHYMLSGTPPFVSEQLVGVMVKHLSEPVPDLPAALADGQAPSNGLRTIHQALMAKRRLDRPPTTQSVLKAFRALARGEKIDVFELLDEARGVALSTGDIAPTVAPPPSPKVQAHLAGGAYVPGKAVSATGVGETLSRLRQDLDAPPERRIVFRLRVDARITAERSVRRAKDHRPRDRRRQRRCSRDRSGVQRGAQRGAQRGERRVFRAERAGQPRAACRQRNRRRRNVVGAASAAPIFCAARARADVRRGAGQPVGGDQPLVERSRRGRAAGRADAPGRQTRRPAAARRTSKAGGRLGAERRARVRW